MAGRPQKFLTLDSPDKYPEWVCAGCGKRWGYRDHTGGAATWHEGQCGVCDEVKAVTEPRDFGHLRVKYRNKHGQ